MISLTGKIDEQNLDERLQTNFFSINQVHENKLYILEQDLVWTHYKIDGDAILSEVGAISVYTSDCLPIAILGNHRYAIVVK